MRLTPEQKRIMIVLCDAAENMEGKLEDITTGVKLQWLEKAGHSPIRETTTGAALVRKGLAVRLYNGEFSATCEGYWLGDSLRAADRRGEVPARRSFPE